MLDVAATEQAFRSSAAAVRRRRDVLELSGPDAATYLHGQLSQDVTGLAVGASAMTLLLQPQGKVESWLRLSRVGDHRYWLDLAAGHGQASLARLKRFMLRVDVELRLSEVEMVAVRGPGAATGAAALGFTTPPGGAILPALWPGVDGFDVLSAPGQPDQPVVLPAGVDEGHPDALDALRIRLGVPAMGAELTTATIPAAAGVVEQSVDFTKGCFVGQELVARIDARGSNTPTHLRGIRLAGEAPAGALAPGAELVRGDQAVGTVTSAALGSIGLGYVKRSVDVPSGAELITADGSRVAVDLVALPFSEVNGGARG